MKKNKNTEDRLKIIDDRRKKAPGVVIVGVRPKRLGFYSEETAQVIREAHGF